MSTSFIMSLITIGLLCGVGGLALWLHLRLTRFQTAAHKFTKMSQHVTQTLNKAQTEIQTLKETLTALQPHVKEGERVAQDLDFLTYKAEKMIKQLEESTTPTPPQTSPAVHPTPQTAEGKLKTKLQSHVRPH